MATFNVYRNFLRFNISSCSVLRRSLHFARLSKQELDVCIHSQKHFPIFVPSMLLSTSIRQQKDQANVNSGTKDHIDALVKNNKVVVFMKGIPDQPMCGFSNAVVQVLRMHGVEYDSHNVLDDDDLRAGIKTYSNWPTIPQVYFNGEFIGGCDVLLEMHRNGDLIDELKTIGIRSALLDKK